MKKIILALMLTVSASFATWTNYSAVSTGEIIYYLNHYCQIGTPTIQGPSYVTYATGNNNLCGVWQISDTFKVSYYQCTDTGTSYKVMVYIYPMTWVSSCPTGQDLNASGVCSAPPTPTCTQNQVLNTSTNKCDCKPGYKQDYTGLDDNNLQPTNTCSPKKICPPQMKYFWTDQAIDAIWHTKVEYTSCEPRTDLTPADCASQSGSYLTKSMMTDNLKDPTTAYIFVHGEGCANISWINSEAWWNNFSLIMSGFVVNGTGAYNLASKAVKPEQLLLTYKNAASDVKLLTNEPEVIDLVMGSDGVYSSLDTVAKDASADSATLAAYNQFLKDNGYSVSDITPFETPVNDLGVSSSVSSAMDSTNIYKGGDQTSFSDNILGAAKVFQKADSFATDSSSLNIGATKTSTIDLSSLLDNASSTKSYPVASTVMEKSTASDATVTTKTVSKINYPDGTYSSVTSLEQKFADATARYDITVSTPIATTNGTKTIEQAYTVTKNATGATTNTIVTNTGTISTVSASGHTTTTSNTSTSTAPTDTNLASPLNLSNIQASLNQLNQTATDIKNLVKDLVEYVPANKVAFDQALANFDKGFNNFSLKLNDFLNFLGGFPPLIDNFKSQLDDLLAMFDDKPSLSLPDGQCPFPAHWYGKSFMVDPCLYVRPYRPIISVFLTFFATWVIFVFVIKYMFRIGLRGE